MNRFDLFNAQLAKFQSLLAENKLAGEFRTNEYPISLVVTPEQTDEAQMEMFATETDGTSSKDAKLVLTFPITGIGVNFYGKFILTDDLLNKIKSHGKKLRDLYLQAFFATFKDSEPRYTSSAINEDEPEGDEFETDAADFAEFFSADDEDFDVNDSED